MNAAAKRTVVVLNDYCNVNGGASRVALDEAVALANMGVEVIFVGAVGPIAPELRDAPLRTICLEQDELANAGMRPGVMAQGLWNRNAYKAVAELLRELDASRTVVHLHGYTKALTTSPVRAAGAVGVSPDLHAARFLRGLPEWRFFRLQRSRAMPAHAAVVRLRLDQLRQAPLRAQGLPGRPQPGAARPRACCRAGCAITSACPRARSRSCGSTCLLPRATTLSRTSARSRGGPRWTPPPTATWWQSAASTSRKASRCCCRPRAKRR